MVKIRIPGLAVALLAAAGCASSPPQLGADFSWPSGEYIFFGLIENRDRFEGTVTFYDDHLFSMDVRGISCDESGDWRVPRPRQIMMRCRTVTLEFDVVNGEPHSPARIWLETDQVVERRGRCLRSEGGRCIEWQTMRMIETVRRPGSVTMRRTGGTDSR